MMMSREELETYLERMFKEDVECFRMLDAGEPHKEDTEKVTENPGENPIYK